LSLFIIWFAFPYTINMVQNSNEYQEIYHTSGIANGYALKDICNDNSSNHCLNILTMKKTNPYQCAMKTIRRKIAIAALILLTAAIMQGCTKQQSSKTGGTQQSAVSASSIESVVTKEQALARLNEHFANEFSTITMEQVQGLTRKQFTQWLRGSKMAVAEDLFLDPLLSTNGNEYVLLKNVTVKETGKLATVGLIATTPPSYPQYTRMVAVINSISIFNNRKICAWKKCDSYSACPCILWLDVVTGDCPSDKCITDYDCRGFSGGDCDGELTDITTFEMLEAF